MRHMLVRVAEKKQGTALPEESYGKGLSFVLLLLGWVGGGILTTLMLLECDSGSSSEAWEVPAEGILGPDHPLSNEVKTKSEVVQEGDRETKERGAPAGDWLLRGSWRDEWGPGVSLLVHYPVSQLPPEKLPVGELYWRPQLSSLPLSPLCLCDLLLFLPRFPPSSPEAHQRFLNS